MKKNILNILIIAFILRFILLVINTYFFVLPQGGGDALSFERNAYLISISNYRNLNYLEYFSSGAKLFSLLSSFVYLFVGRQPFILGLTIVILGVYNVKLTHKATLLLWKDYKIARKAAWFTALFPVLILHSAIILREIPINFFLLLSIIYFIKYWKYKNKKMILLFFINSIFATLLHSGSIFLIFGFLYVILFNSTNKNIFSKIFIFSSTIFLVYLLNSSGFLNKIGGSFDESLTLLETRENYILKGNSAYPNWIMMTGGINDIWKIPIRFIAFLFSPLIPFWAKSIWHSIGLIDAFIYLFMLLQIYKKRKLFKKNVTAKAILIMSLFLVFVFSLGVANFGTTIRHRAKIAPLLIIVFSGMYFEKSKIKIK